jgi:hypothetical protein
LKTDLERIQEKEKRKFFRPFSSEVTQRIKESLSAFKDTNAGKAIKIKFLGITPSVQHAKKINEIIPLINQYVSCDYSNTVLTADSPVILHFNPDSHQMAVSFFQVLTIIYPSGGIERYANQRTGKDELTIFLLESPRFSDDGTLYFE